MQADRFDQLTKTLGTGSSRRALLRGLGSGLAGALLAPFVSRRVGATQLGDCAAFCLQLPAGQARGQCISDAARGRGLCYQCGPAATTPFLSFCQSTGTCVSNFCNVRKVFDPGTCGCVCAPEFVPLPGGFCAISCTTSSSTCACVTTTEGQRVCADGYLVVCTICAASMDCVQGCSASNAICSSSEGVCRVVI